MNTFGNIFKITTFGESHGVGLGTVIDNCPAGISLSESDLQAELDRRRPGQSDITTPRSEKDKCQILSGIFQGKLLARPSPSLFSTKTNNHKIIIISKIFSAPPTPILAGNPNLEIVIIAVAVVALDEKLYHELLAEQSLRRFYKKNFPWKFLVFLALLVENFFQK